MIRVGVVGYGTIGKRVADAVRAQPDMRLAGAVKRSPDYAAAAAERSGVSLFAAGEESAERFAAVDADGIVALGGGSSIDVATLVRVLVADDRSPRDIGAEFGERGTISVPADLPPMVVVPTTLAGAEL